MEIPHARWRRHRGDDETVRANQTIRFGTTREALAGLRPSFRDDGRATAGNSLQISDGAAGRALPAADNVLCRRARNRHDHRACSVVAGK
ncbi:hypothetical protein [Mesorhizobium sp. ANAO-SY3R2]|uniref:thiolase family protein n=1 Tax=Mesorhizobium sp. ANAO-SY3R2 TaxID=3166644 RepID=UPI00366D1C7D